MKLRWMILAMVGAVACAFASNNGVEGVDQVQQRVNAAARTFALLYENYSVIFDNELSEAAYIKAQLDLREAAQLMAERDAAPVDLSEVDRVVAEATLVQTLLKAYLGPKEFFGQRLREEPFHVYIEYDWVLKKVSSRFPFLKPLANDQKLLDPGEEAVSQFNALREDFYRLIELAVSLDADAERIKALISWGRMTEVIYPGDSFGKTLYH